MINTSLHLQIGHSLSLTPQLQQAIRLLQYSSLELSHEIQQMLESNIMLTGDQEAFSQETTEASVDTPVEASFTIEESSVENDSYLHDIPEQISEDSQWQDVYDDGTDLGQYKNGPVSDEPVNYETFTAAQTTLFDHLKLQLDQNPWVDEADYESVLALIDAIDDKGYLSLSLDEISESLSPRPSLSELTYLLEEIVQQFEPTGVGARNLQECLTLQLYALPPGAIRRIALRCVEDHFEWLSTRQYALLQKKLAISEDSLKSALALIRSCKSEPAEAFNQATDYIKPDLYLIKQGQQWRISLNPKALPPVEINQAYAGMVKQVKNPQEAEMMRQHLQEARWFLKNIQNRNDTLLRVGEAILEKQQDFFEQGPEAMRPMTLKDIAEMLELHESTISRATSHKYLSTPMGTFELKYFFNSQVQSGLGEGTSSLAIQAKIRKLVHDENPQKPLSDSKIADLLNEDGIPVARRTVAKYREAINIPSSSDRRKMKA
jgi:RNA polymerase sigma-54 factor